MEMKPSPLSDLSFFRFPDLTQQIVAQIVVLLLLLVLLVLAAIVLQRLVFQKNAARRRRRMLEEGSEVGRLAPPLREVLEKLAGFSAVGSAGKILHDPAAYEAAVAVLAERATAAELEALAKLRRAFHLNVMNPEVELLSTRQLLPDLSVRIVVGAGPDKLDLYCALLDVDERFLFFDMSYQEEVFGLLRASPAALLIYWREEGGETLFQVTLEPVPAPGEIPMFRARHALRAEDIAQRGEFRLSVDFPVRYQYLEQGALRQVRMGQGKEAPPRGGEGMLRDLSYGGAAFTAAGALPPGGFAQLQFQLQGNPCRIMVEPISNNPLPEGGVLVRGRMRGMPHEAKTLLYNFLSREQLRRLRQKEAYLPGSA